MATARELMEAAKTKIEANQAQAATIGAVYKFVLDGAGGGTFVLNLKDHPGVTEGDGPAECTIQMTASDYVDMVEGRASGQRLFFAGKLTITGDMGLALKLQQLTVALR